MIPLKIVLVLVFVLVLVVVRSRRRTACRLPARGVRLIRVRARRQSAVFGRSIPAFGDTVPYVRRPPHQLMRQLPRQRAVRLHQPQTQVNHHILVSPFQTTPYDNLLNTVHLSNPLCGFDRRDPPRTPPKNHGKSILLGEDPRAQPPLDFPRNTA